MLVALDIYVILWCLVGGPRYATQQIWPTGVNIFIDKAVSHFFYESQFYEETLNVLGLRLFGNLINLD